MSPLKGHLTRLLAIFIVLLLEELSLRYLLMQVHLENKEDQFQLNKSTLCSFWFVFVLHLQIICMDDTYAASNLVVW